MQRSDLTSVRENTFIDRYTAMMNDLETSSAYDLFGALWCLSNAVGRRTFVDRPRAPVYLNMFVIFAAQSGKTRKSTAVKEAGKVLKAFNKHNLFEMTTIESKTTPEALEFLLQSLSREYGYAYASIIIPELITFLGKERYNLHMPGLLTDLYDSPDARIGGGTLARGPSRTENVFVNFLSASTPSWLVRAINPDVVEGGFTSRCLFVVSERPKRAIAWPSNAENREEHKALGDELARIHSRMFEALPSETFARVYPDDRTMGLLKKWYEGRRTHKDPFRASFESREDDHALRIASLLSINNGTAVITPDTLQDAINLVDWVKMQGAALFAYSSNDKLVSGIDKLRLTLIECGLNGIRQSKLTKAVSGFMDAETMLFALEVMHELSMVQRFEKRNERGRPATIWRATNLISGESAIELILEHWSVHDDQR